MQVSVDGGVHVVFFHHVCERGIFKARIKGRVVRHANDLFVIGPELGCFFQAHFQTDQFSIEDLFIFRRLLGGVFRYRPGTCAAYNKVARLMRVILYERDRL